MSVCTSYDVYNTVHVIATFTDTITGVVADPTTVTFYVRDAAHAIASYVYGVDSAVGKTSTGIYTFDFDVTAPGTWWYAVRGTGAVKAFEEVQIEVEYSPFYTG